MDFIEALAVAGAAASTRATTQNGHRDTPRGSIDPIESSHQAVVTDRRPR
jgi:hypothetical protein